LRRVEAAPIRSGRGGRRGASRPRRPRVRSWPGNQNVDRHPV